MKSATQSFPRHRRTLRALAALLEYPGEAVRAALPELAEALAGDGALTKSRQAEVLALIQQLATLDPYAAEARYVETFDRGRTASLHVFEHVHGDSRARGPALIDLGLTYEQAGLRLAPGELPDFLPVVLEFASTQPERVARDFLGEMEHVLAAVFSALVKRRSPYASVVAAVLEVADFAAEAVPVAAEPPLDEAWAEPPAFDGCSTQGQARPGAAQPMTFVRKSTLAQGADA